MRKTLLVLLAIALLATLAAACKPKAAPAPETGQAAADEMLYDDIRDLEGLKSYRSKSVTSWTEEGGVPQSVTIELAYTAEPEAQHLVMSGLSDAAQGGDGTLEMIRIGQDRYARFGGEWITMQAAEGQLLPEATAAYQPENLLRSSKGKYVGTETMNGVRAKHYVFDKDELSKSPIFVNVIEASGEVWVSTEHNVAVRSIVHFKGKDAAKDKIVTLDVETNLTDINGDIVITPPEGVEKAETPSDVPIMSGATDLVVMMAMTSYKVIQPAEAALILTGKQKKVKPKGGILSRLVSFSIWKYPFSMPAKCASQITRGSPFSLNSAARYGRGRSQLPASMPTPRPPCSVRKRGLSRSSPAPLTRYSGVPQASSAPVWMRTMSSGLISYRIRSSSFRTSATVMRSPSALWRKSSRTPARRHQASGISSIVAAGRPRSICGW